MHTQNLILKFFLHHHSLHTQHCSSIGHYYSQAKFSIESGNGLGFGTAQLCFPSNGLTGFRSPIARLCVIIIYKTVRIICKRDWELKIMTLCILHRWICGFSDPQFMPLPFQSSLPVIIKERLIFQGCQKDWLWHENTIKPDLCTQMARHCRHYSQLIQTILFPYL